MSRIRNDWRDDVYKKVAEEFNMSWEDVKALYKMYWKYIREYIESMSFDEDMSEEEFYKCHRPVRIINIGTICFSYPHFKKIKKRMTKDEEAKEDKADV